MITREEALNMAREAGIGLAEGLGGMDEFLEVFAEMVAAKEREACALVCDRRAGTIDNDRRATLISAAMAIRARGAE